MVTFKADVSLQLSVGTSIELLYSYLTSSDLNFRNDCNESENEIIARMDACAFAVVQNEECVTFDAKAVAGQIH